MSPRLKRRGALGLLARRRRAQRSLWLSEAVTERPLPRLQGQHRADVAIIGGGYVGLWTALRISELEPSARVVLLEGDICGGGASGRNGGFALSWWSKLPSLVRLFGEEEAVQLAQASLGAIDDISTFCKQRCPAAEFRRSGWLWTATSPAHDNSWARVMELTERLGQRPFTPLAAKTVAARSGSPVHLSGVLENSAAVVHPGHLVRGLRQAALDSGVDIYENTRVRALSRVGPPLIKTTEGTVQADRVVIATNAWAAGMPELHTKLFVISSDMIATEPIPDRLEEIGWRNGPAITDSQTLVCYYRTTRAGRVMFGKGGWTIGLGGWMSPSMDRNARRTSTVSRDFRRYYPMLRDVAITHDWAGPIDRTHNSLPLINWLDRSRRIAYGVGWSGNGVGPSRVGAKVLASMVLDRDDEWSGSGLVNAPFRRFPPDPVRYIGAHLVREGIVRKERAEALDLKPSQIALFLSRLAPSGLEDKE